jgi:hypothetical protein
MNRRTRILAAMLIASWTGGCQRETAPSAQRRASIPASPTPASAAIVSKQSIGKTISVEGEAVNQKLGAALVVEGGRELWIAELGHWPDGYWTMGKPGKRLRVTGVLSEAYDRPVFVGDIARAVKNNDPIPQGSFIHDPAAIRPDGGGGKGAKTEPSIRPAPKAARHRFLLKNARWEPVGR